MRPGRLSLRAAVLLLALTALASAGCVYAPRDIQHYSWETPRVIVLGATPWVTVDGAPANLATGRGGEILFERRGGRDFSQLRCAFSHHWREPGRPEADYLRLGIALILPTFPTDSPCGFTAAVGPTLNHLSVDGPGDRFGIGLSLSPELWLSIRGHCTRALGCTAEGWVSTAGDLIGSLAPYLRFGFSF